MLAGTVEVVVAGEAGLLAGLDEGVRKRIDVAQVRHRQRTIAAVQRVGAAVVALAEAEVRPHRVQVPAVGAARCTAGVVEGYAAPLPHKTKRRREGKECDRTVRYR